MKTFTIAAILVAAGLLAATLFQRTDHAGAGPETGDFSEAGRFRMASPDAILASESTTPSVTGYGSEYLVCSLEANSLSDGVTFEQVERIPDGLGNGAFPLASSVLPGSYRLSVDHDISFAPWLFSARHGHEYLVAGPPLQTVFDVNDPTNTTTNPIFGQTAVMMLSIIAPTGGLQVSRSVSNTPLGVPAPEHGALVTVRGDEYATLGHRSDYVIRSQVLGVLPFNCASIVVDPNRRYFIFLDGDNGDVYLSELQSIMAPPHLLGSSGTLSQLSTATSLELITAAPDGRRCLIVTVDEGQCLFYDPENDGVFDAGAFVDHSQYAALGIGDGDGFSNFAAYSQIGDF